jgi:protein-serine/threonine kinase
MQSSSSSGIRKPSSRASLAQRDQLPRQPTSPNPVGGPGESGTDCKCHFVHVLPRLPRFRPPSDVYFDRDPSCFSEDAQVRAKGAQLKLENYYKLSVDAAVERNQRYVLCHIANTRSGCSRYDLLSRVELERSLQGNALVSDSRKSRQLAQLGKKESNFLRLRRTKIGLNDFRTVKVIGKGAFGEVGETILGSRLLTLLE